MGEQGQQAAFDPTPRWKRRLRSGLADLRFHMGYPWRRFCYRPFSRLIHRYGFHHAPANHALTNDAGWVLHRCSWCGLTGFVMPKLTPEQLAAPLGAFVRSRAPAVRSAAQSPPPLPPLPKEQG